MSLILDALRKSERRRQQTLTGQIGNHPGIPGRARVPMPWATLIGMILLLNAVVLGFLLWHSERTAPDNAVPNAQLTTREVPSHPAIRPLSVEAETGAEPMLAAPHAAPETANKAKNTVAAPATQSAAVSAPLLDTLPMAFQQTLPTLHLDVHGYAANPRERFVVINMQRYVAGDIIKEGPRVIAITPQGVILQYNDTRFLLPRN